MSDYKKLLEESESRFSGLQAALENETQARAAVEAELAKFRGILQIHQTNADALTGAAEQVLAANLSAEEKLGQLAQIIGQAKKFGSGREAERLRAEAEQLRAEAAAKEAQATALE